MTIVIQLIMDDFESSDNLDRDGAERAPSVDHTVRGEGYLESKFYQTLLV